MKPHPLATLTLLSLLLLLSIAAGIAFGAVPLDWARALGDSGSPDATILFVARLPRVALGALAGGVLAVAGVAFQALLRNPLAEPYTLGVASGAALSALLAIQLGATATLLGASMITLAAFVGAIGTVALVVLLARRQGALPVSAMLLAGITLSLVFGALGLVIHMFADFGQSYRFLRWLMGSVDVAGWQPVAVALVPAALGLGLVAAHARELNLLAIGESFARTRGVELARVLAFVFVGASLATAGVIATTGPIGFVGLIVPHLLRRLLGADHRTLIPGAFLGGAAILVLGDLVARRMFAPVEIPVGVLTALVGGPLFLWLMRK